MESFRFIYLFIFSFLFQHVDAQFTQYGKTMEYHGRKAKTSYISPVSICFQGCSPTNNDHKGNISLFFPASKAGNVVSCTDIEISNPKYVIFNKNDFDIWTLGEREMPIVLCEKSKIDNYIAIYTKVQMDASEAKYEAKKKELQKSKEDNTDLKNRLRSLEAEHIKEINDIKSNALIFAYVDEEKLDSLQYEQHRCILNGDIEGAVKIGEQIDFKNNINKQLSNFELSIKKSQEIGFKLFEQSEALYLHLSNCDLLSLKNDSVKENYKLLIKTYRSLLEQYPTNFKCSEAIYNNTKLKLGNIIYNYLYKFYDIFYVSNTDNAYSHIHDYMKESASYGNSKAIYWLAEQGENLEEVKYYAKLLLNGISSGSLNFPVEGQSFYDIKDICTSIPDIRIDNSSMVYYYNILNEDEVSLVHAHCKDSTLRKISIPEKVIYNNHKYTVTEIGACAFGCDSYASDYNIGRRWVKEEEFHNNFGILVQNDTLDEYFTHVKLYFPKTLKYVGIAAFDPRLQPVVFKIKEIPRELEVLRAYSFNGCIYKKNIIINNKITAIEEQALPGYYDENDKDEPFKCNYNITIPFSLKKLDTFKRSEGKDGDFRTANILSINNNPNFRLIDGSLYNADSSYVYLGTIGQNNKRLNITRNLRFDDNDFDILSNYLYLDDIFIDSINIDNRNPYYTYHDKCLYTKQADTLLYVIPFADRVRLLPNIKSIRPWILSDVNYELPDDINVIGMIEFLIKAIYHEEMYHKLKFEYKGKIYNFETNDSIDTWENFLLDFQKHNDQDPKVLCAIGLINLNSNKYSESLNLLKSIYYLEGQSGVYFNQLIDSCISYKNSMLELVKQLNHTDYDNHYKNIEICNKLRPYLNNVADNSSEEDDILDAFYMNWKCGIHETYRYASSVLECMEYADIYAKRLLELYNNVENKKTCSDFYTTMAKIVWYKDKNKTFSSLQKALELNPLNIETYELLGDYYNENETNIIKKETELSKVLNKILTINPDYIPTSDSVLKDLYRRKSNK